MPANVYGYCPGFNEVSKRFIRNVYDTQSDDGTVNDVRDLIRYWSLEGIIFYENFDVGCLCSIVAAHFAFGVDLDCKRDEHGYAKEIQDGIQAFIESLFELQTALPLYKVFPTSSYKKFNEGLDQVYKIGHKYASKYVSDIKASAAVSEKAHGMSLLEQWLIEGNMSLDEAVANAVGMLGAGMDTVS